MTLISKIGAAFLIVLLGVAAVCEAQEGRNHALEQTQSEDEPSGLQCSTGEPNQPRPEVELRLGDVTKKATKLPRPNYSQKLRDAGISGEVRAEVVIDAHTGNVIWAQIKNGHPLLQEAVGKVVCQAHFAPLFIDSSPIRASGIITYKIERVSRNRVLSKRVRR